jgi:hypothetical protein
MQPFLNTGARSEPGERAIAHGRAPSTPRALGRGGRTSIRWGGARAWQIFLDTDQNSKTGYNGGGIAVGAEYMFEADGGIAHLLRYAGTGTD